MSLSQLISTIVDNNEGYGPSADHLPSQFKDIPYAPFSKNDKLGRVVDWNLDSPSSSAQASASNSNPARRNPAQSNAAAGGGGKYGREPKEAFGAGSAGTFAYFHDEDEASFSLVDGKTASKRGGGGGGQGQGMGMGASRAPFGRGGAAGARGARGGRGAMRGGVAVAAGRGRGGQQAQAAGRGAQGRGGWKDWNKETRTREASVVVGSDWAVLEEIEFSRLAKLRLDVDTEDPETISTHGFLYEYDKTFDRINTKAEKPLQIIDRIRYNPTTSDDPIIQELAAKDKAQIFATDAILSMLMCTTRSVYPWDIVLTREGNKLFMDKREGGPFDYPSVNENASDPPLEDDKDSLNSPSALSLEATYINQNFAFQVVREDAPDSRVQLEHPNPFYSPDETEPLASCAYRYRKFDLSITEDEDVQIIVRTEVDSFIKATSPNDEDTFVTIKTLNEFNSRAQGAGGAPDWRTKLDSQRGAVIATEMKNNSCKLSRWAVQSILAGAEQMKMGYVSRVNPRDASRHTILGTQWYKPREFASQMNVNLGVGWGIVRTIADLCLKQPEGKYVLMKDPNKPVIRLYRVPGDTFEAENEALEDDFSAQGSDDGGIFSHDPLPAVTFPYTIHVLDPAEYDALALVDQLVNFRPTRQTETGTLLALCAVPTHEERYIVEWLTYHALLGVEVFYLFDNLPSEGMRSLLRPWLDAGMVVLYELDYQESPFIGSRWQQDLLKLCSSQVLPIADWALHIDIDEFLHVDSPGTTNYLPTQNEVGRWEFPLLRILEGRLREAECVPLARISFSNVGVRDLRDDQMVIKEHLVRETLGPQWKAWGKVLIHSKKRANSVAWMGPHSCSVKSANKILDASGSILPNPYPAEGLPLPHEGLTLFRSSLPSLPLPPHSNPIPTQPPDYVQRSLTDCYSKVSILLNTPSDWRSIDGLSGCATNYLPSESELKPGAAFSALLREEYGTLLAQRGAEERLVGDTRGRDSWAGRMTGEILREWRNRGGPGMGREEEKEVGQGDGEGNLVRLTM